MRICVFGANGSTGRLLAVQAGEEGHEITAFTRRPERFPFTSPGLVVRRGDVADRDQVRKAVVDHDAVISTLGVPFSWQPIETYSVGARNILDAMVDTGVERFVAVSSTGVEANPAPVGGPIFRRVIQPLVISTIGKTTYDDQRRMEAIIRASPADWTIVRPSGLFTGPRVTAYDVSLGHGRGLTTSRRDLADCLLREVTGTGHSRQVIAVVTTEGTPSLVSIIWNEGIRKQH